MMARREKGAKHLITRIEAWMDVEDQMLCPYGGRG